MAPAPSKAAILATGEELVSGRRIDTNSSFIQQRLRRIGIAVAESRQVGDALQDIQEALEDQARCHCVVIVTGGLGPTEDDRTREAVARVAGVPLVESPSARAHLEEFLRRLGRRMPASNLRQALLPEGAELLDNPKGTAPGFRLSIHAADVFVLPGVPLEMKWMLEHQVAPRLKNSSLATLEDRILQVVGVTESQLGEMLQDWMQSSEPPAVSVTAHAGVMTVCLTDRGDAAGLRRLDELQAKVEQILGAKVFSRGEETLEKALVDLLRARSETLAVAESCTGGLLAAGLTDVPGASEVLLEGAVTYSNAAKTRTLGVAEDLLEQFGAVSEPVARVMAEGIRQRAASTYGIGITGIAGPGGGTPDKPVGRVHIAIATASRTEHRKLQVTGDRGLIRKRSAIAALALLRRCVATKGTEDSR